MVEVIGVRFNNAGKVYYFDPKGQSLVVGTQVLVETARGVELGHIVMANKEVDDSEIVPPLRPIIRIATEADFTQVKENKEKEKEAFVIASEKVREHNLDMKLVDVEYTFDRSKILFYFTADGRVDFRELVKTLAGIFHTRIELRQIGVRDEARQLGSYGICGRYLCCGTFLDDFHPVSIKMAKEQGLSLNPTKISGICGRLMCCLQYEQNAYEYMLKKLPHKGAVVETADGKGVVADVATLKGEIRVKFETGDSVRFATYKLGEFTFRQSNSAAAAIEADASDEAALFTEETSSQSKQTGDNEKPAESRRDKRSRRDRHRNKNSNKNNSTSDAKVFVNPDADDPDAE